MIWGPILMHAEHAFCGGTANENRFIIQFSFSFLLFLDCQNALVFLTDFKKSPK